METGKSKLCRANQQAGDPGKSWCCSSNPKAVWRQNASCSGDVSLFLVKPSAGWMRPTHIRECNLLYLVSTGLNVNLILKNTFTATSIVWPIIWVLWPSQVDLYNSPSPSVSQPCGTISGQSHLRQEAATCSSELKQCVGLDKHLRGLKANVSCLGMWPQIKTLCMP